MHEVVRTDGSNSSFTALKRSNASYDTSWVSTTVLFTRVAGKDGREAGNRVQELGSVEMSRTPRGRGGW